MEYFSTLFWTGFFFFIATVVGSILFSRVIRKKEITFSELWLILAISLMGTLALLITLFLFWIAQHGGFHQNPLS